MLISELRGINPYGETSGTFTVNYEDSNGIEKQITQTLETRIIRSEDLTENEKAAREEEQFKRNALSAWWISVLATAAVIAILCSVIVADRLGRLAKIK